MKVLWLASWYPSKINTSKGIFVQDYAQAVKWYRMAADQGLAEAQLNLGVMYANGYGVKRDDAQAVRLYRLAAEQGNNGAMVNLSRMQQQGRGMK